ncbi:hypothetical protein NDU88_004523 [Pleurodeles waltl]|uniref:Uncharacterized protein n=1 Tax=Pleurodeles waltl TaxID=8319 RepID=A0AAV7MAB5_PLEWA|nr:hypothetical protein NDU88_004523 [Pleurodeles waltl]
MRWRANPTLVVHAQGGIACHTIFTDEGWLEGNRTQADGAGLSRLLSGPISGRRGGACLDRPQFVQDLPIPRLSADDRASLEADILVEELGEALAQLNSEKASEPNGFLPEYWGLVWQQVSQPMLDMFQEAWERLKPKKPHLEEQKGYLSAARSVVSFGHFFYCSGAESLFSPLSLPGGSLPVGLRIASSSGDGSRGLTVFEGRPSHPRRPQSAAGSASAPLGRTLFSSNEGAFSFLRLASISASSQPSAHRYGRARVTGRILHAGRTAPQLVGGPGLGAWSRCVLRRLRRARPGWPRQQASPQLQVRQDAAGSAAILNLPLRSQPAFAA